MTTLRLFEYRCSPHGHRFEAPVLARTYGDLLVRSARPKSERVFRMDDPLGDELASMLAEVIQSEGLRLSEREQGQLFRVTLSVALDPDSDGSSSQVGKPPSCPICGSLDIEDWASIEPPIVSETELPLASHRDWDELEARSKWGRIRGVLAHVTGDGEK